MGCHQPLSTKSPGPPPWLGCCTLLQHGGAALGLALAPDRQRIERFILRRPTVRNGLPPSQPDAESLVTNAENLLLTSVNHRHYHVLGLLSGDVLVCGPTRMTSLCHVRTRLYTESCIIH